MPIRTKWRPGRHLAACDRCGAVYYDDQIKEEWTGLLVCDGPGTRGCYEERHPVDFLRAIPDDMGAVARARPRKKYELFDDDQYLIVQAGYVEDGYWVIDFTV